MTTDDLTERIGRILNNEGWTFEGIHEPGEYDECEDCRRAVDPIAARVAREVAGEVRKAKAEAWDETASHAESKSWLTNFRADDLRTANPYHETGDQR